MNAYPARRVKVVLFSVLKLKAAKGLLWLFYFGYNKQYLYLIIIIIILLSWKPQGREEGAVIEDWEDPDLSVYKSTDRYGFMQWVCEGVWEWGVWQVCMCLGGLGG